MATGHGPGRGIAGATKSTAQNALNWQTLEVLLRLTSDPPMRARKTPSFRPVGQIRTRPWQGRSPMTSIRPRAAYG